MQRSWTIAVAVPGLLAAVVALCGACGNQTVAQSGGGQDTGQPADSGPQPAARVVVSVEPSKAVYVPGDVVRVDATASEVLGAPSGSSNVLWSATPDGAARAGVGQSWTLVGQGNVTFRACVDDGPGDPQVCGAKTIVVDAGPTALRVLEPRPGAFLGGDGDGEVAVVGTASDAFGTPDVYVDGQAAKIAKNGTFFASIRPHFGVNHLEVVASDGISDHSATRDLDFLWAPAYRPLDAGTPGNTASFDDGVVVALGQAFFDDGQPPVAVPESGTMANDLADILSLTLSHLDAVNQIPDPAINRGGLTLHITAVDLGKPRVAVSITDDGLEVDIEIPGIVATTAGSLAVQDQTLSLDGTVTGDLSAVARLQLASPAGAAGWTATLVTDRVALQNLRSNFASPDANALFALANSAVHSQIEQVLASAIDHALFQRLPQLATDALHALNNVLAGRSFTLNLQGFPPLTMHVDGHISSFSARHRDDMRAVLQTDVWAYSGPVDLNAPGIPVMEVGGLSRDDEQVTRPGPQSARIGVRLALLNALFYTAWESGAFTHQPMTPLPLGLDHIAHSVTVNAMLPPVLAPATGSQTYPLTWTLGQFEFTVDYGAQTDTYAARLSVGVSLSIANHRLDVVLANKPALTMWLVSTTGTAPRPLLPAMRRAFLSQIWPAIRAQIQHTLSLPIPLPDLSMLAQISPAMADFSIALRLDRPPRVDRGFVLLDGRLEGMLPAGQ